MLYNILSETISELRYKAAARLNHLQLSSTCLLINKDMDKL